MMVTYQKYKNIILEFMSISLIIVTCKLSTTSGTFIDYVDNDYHY